MPFLRVETVRCTISTTLKYTPPQPMEFEIFINQRYKDDQRSLTSNTGNNFIVVYKSYSPIKKEVDMILKIKMLAEC